MAGFKSERVAGFKLECMAGFVGIRIGEIFDFNRIRTYTVANFHRDMVHLFGEGWEQRYVSDLRKYLNDLPE